MKVKIYLSTDGKNTVEADDIESQEDLDRAEAMYDHLLKKYGTKQGQAVKEYAKKDGFPDDTGDQAHEAQDGVPMCPKHHKPMRKGKFGWYCATPDNDEPKGWCKQKPPMEFMRG